MRNHPMKDAKLTQKYKWSIKDEMILSLRGCTALVLWGMGREEGGCMHCMLHEVGVDVRVGRDRWGGRVATKLLFGVLLHCMRFCMTTTGTRLVLVGIYTSKERRTGLKWAHAYRQAHTCSLSHTNAMWCACVFQFYEGTSNAWK